MRILIKLCIVLFFISGTISAQSNLTAVTEIDYANATRYSGARNIARTTDGYVVVVFEPGSGWTNGDIWYANYNSVFNSWDAAQLSQSPSGETGIPGVVADENGAIHGSWKENTDTGARNIMYSELTFIDAFSHTWSTPVVADTITNNAGVNTINLDENGNPFILFSIWNSPAIFDANIYCSHSYDKGVTWVTNNLTSEFPTPNSLPFNYMDVNLAPGKNGEMYAVWEDKPEPVTNIYEILFSKYTPSSGWSYPEIISPINDGFNPTFHFYVDGLTPISSAVSVYEMGPTGYALEGKSSVIYYDNGTSKVLSAAFNPYYQLKEEREQFISDVINYFSVSSADSVLLVDDDNKYNNENLIVQALEAAGVNFRVFDCGNNSGMATQKPSTADLNGKKLVLWFTGDDSNNLAFWNIADTVNPELKNYLDAPGANLFVIGRDWLYDKYGAAPDTFNTGDFVYDYLGIESYDAQAKADDGGSGVAQLDMTTNNLGISTMDPIRFGKGGKRQGEPSIASDPAGNLHIVYYDERDGEHIKYQKYNGTNWSDAVQIDVSNDTVNVQRPSISVDPKYGVYVIWMEETEEVEGIKVYNVMHSTSPDNGMNWNSPEQLSNTNYVNSSNYSIKNPSIGIKVREEIPGVFEGGADVVWTEASESSSLGYNIMYARIPFVGTLTSVDDNIVNTPYKFSLNQNYPNPFNPSTQIKYQVAQTENVLLKVYDILGNEVATLINEVQQPGEHSIKFNAGNLSSGVYFYKLFSGTNVKTKKMMLLK